MSPEKSKIFLRILFLVAGAWLFTGMIWFRGEPRAREAFLKVFLPTLLDLLSLILLFWSLFFIPPARRNKILLVFFLTFKLVCLGFLAITLKRLRNAPDYAVLCGIAFMGLGPLISALIARKFPDQQQ